MGSCQPRGTAQHTLQGLQLGRVKRPAANAAGSCRTGRQEQAAFPNQPGEHKTAGAASGLGSGVSWEPWAGAVSALTGRRGLPVHSLALLIILYNYTVHQHRAQRLTGCPQFARGAGAACRAGAATEEGGGKQQGGQCSHGKLWEVPKNLFHEPHPVPCRGDGEDTPAPQASEKSTDNPLLGWHKQFHARTGGCAASSTLLPERPLFQRELPRSPCTSGLWGQQLLPLSPAQTAHLS